MSDEAQRASDLIDRSAILADLPSLNLVGGNPGSCRASFTRFLLPFKWSSTEKVSLDPARPHFRRAGPDDRLHPADPAESELDKQRRRYLTSETDSLLFKNASWFVLETPDHAENLWRELNVSSGIDGSNYVVHLRPPAVVLFEASSSADEGNHTEHNLLRNGFLIHEAYFPGAPPRGVDFLRFNEIFRYWRRPFPEHETYCAAELESIAKGIRRADDAGSLYEAQWTELLSLPIELDAGAAIRIVNSAESTGATPSWLVNPDDRAFTMPFAVVANGNVAPAPAFSAFLAVLRDPKTPAAPGYWIKLLNVDRPERSDCDRLGDASDFEIAWANQRSYKRWAHVQTLYGFCEHAFAAMVGPARLDDGPHGEPPLAAHFAGPYLDVTLLLLYLRVTVLRFSQRLHEVTRASLKERGRRREIERWRKRFHEIRWQFLLLENLYQYPHLSNQQQHLEMYALQRESMDVRELYAEIDKEVRASDEFLNNELDQQRNELDEKRNELAVSLNVVAVFGLAAALALGWMDAHSTTQSGLAYFVALFVICLAGLMTPILLARPAGRVLSRLAALDTKGRLAALVVAIGACLALSVGLGRLPSLANLFSPNEVVTPSPTAVTSPTPTAETKE